MSHVLSECGSYEELYFMQDGPPPRFAPTFRAWPVDHILGQCIGRGGLTERPPRSSERTL